MYYKVGHSVLQTGQVLQSDGTLLQSGAGIRNWGKHCYKLWQLGVITKWGKSWYKVVQVIYSNAGKSLLQSGAVISK